MLIGISPRFIQNQQKSVGINNQYLENLINVGLTPIIFPADLSSIKELLPKCDGFLIPGGGDIDPVYYEINDSKNDNLGIASDIDDLLDQIDAMIIGFSVKYRLPLFGICRGLQAINIFMGGSVWKDLTANGYHHVYPENMHQVNKLRDYKLSLSLPQSFMVNTIHHQAIKELAPDFVALYECDGIIEAIIHRELPIIGVQWHPERLQSNESSEIFKYFAKQLGENHEVN